MFFIGSVRSDGTCCTCAEIHSGGTNSCANCGCCPIEDGSILTVTLEGTYCFIDYDCCVTACIDRCLEEPCTDCYTELFEDGCIDTVTCYSDDPECVYDTPCDELATGAACYFEKSVSYTFSGVYDAMLGTFDGIADWEDPDGLITAPTSLTSLAATGLFSCSYDGSGDLFIFLDITSSNSVLVPNLGTNTTPSGFSTNSCPSFPSLNGVDFTECADGDDIACSCYSGFDETYHSFGNRTVAGVPCEGSILSWSIV